MSTLTCDSNIIALGKVKCTTRSCVLCFMFVFVVLVCVLSRGSSYFHSKTPRKTTRGRAKSRGSS